MKAAPKRRGWSRFESFELEDQPRLKAKDVSFPEIEVTMPTYDYQCSACKHKWEEFQSIKAPPTKKCPECKKAKAERLIGTGAGIIFKGSGFYQTDYRSSAYSKAAEADKSAQSEASKSDSSSKSESKPAESKSSTPKSTDSK